VQDLEPAAVDIFVRIVAESNTVREVKVYPLDHANGFAVFRARQYHSS
jgi:hypothetical protein